MKKERKTEKANLMTDSNRQKETGKKKKKKYAEVNAG